MLQRLPVDELHDNVGRSVFFANVIDRADVWMVEPRCSLRFTPKAFQRSGVFGGMLGQKLQGDRAMQTLVLCFVNDTHAPATELARDLVVGNGLTDHPGSNVRRPPSYRQCRSGISAEIASLTGPWESASGPYAEPDP